MRSTPHHRRGLHLLSTAILASLLMLPACRRGVPVIDTAARPANPDGTISGLVRGPGGTSPIVGRVVEVTNVYTGDRKQEATTSTGGFAFKLRPGKYRVELTLRKGESWAKRPGVIDLNTHDADVHADFDLGVARTSHRLPAGVSGSSGLGPPIA
ncbi:MAG: carboxypeptidase-like regulatory domain-containing protein [Vicinamibacterales bacterium]